MMWDAFQHTLFGKIKVQNSEYNVPPFIYKKENLWEREGEVGSWRDGIVRETTV